MPYPSKVETGPAGFIFKGNRNRKGQWTYHAPGMHHCETGMPFLTRMFRRNKQARRILCRCTRTRDNLCRVDQRSESASTKLPSKGCTPGLCYLRAR